jgi:hypothetical protein
MPGETDRLVEEGERALRAGDWIGARDVFRAALRQAEAPEALNGLGEALWWLGAMQESINARERAYAAFRGRQDRLRLRVSRSLYVCITAPMLETLRHRPAGLLERPA